MRLANQDWDLFLMEGITFFIILVCENKSISFIEKMIDYFIYFD